MKSNIVDPIVSRLLASWQTNLLSVSVSLCLSVCLSLSFSMILSSKVQLSAHREQRRRLVINIGGKKNLGQKYWGGKILGKYVFRQDSKTISKKSSSILWNFWRAFFSHWQFFSKMYTLHSKFTPFTLNFSFFVSVSDFFHVYLF